MRWKASLVLAALLQACAGGGGQQPSTKGVAWQSSRYNSGVTLKAQGGAEFTFSFPSNGHVNLIERNWTTPIKVGSTITINYKITGNTTFKSLDPSKGLNPNFRVMLTNGDEASTDGRFWPSGTQCAWLVADGQVHGYSVKIDPKLWTNVNGQVNQSGFNTLINHLYQVALAFGGGKSFSHGISDGGATFTLISFNVT